MWRFMFATRTNKQIFIVDREVAALEPLRRRLGEAGFAVRLIDDGPAALEAVTERPPHLVIFDWNMPGFAGLEVIRGVRKVRAPQEVRLIILSALSAEEDVVTGLNLGADDYIAKPFSLREVVARVSALLRCHPHEAQPQLSCDDLVIDASANRVTARGRLVNLRGVEYRLLEFLMSHRGKTFNRRQLLAQVWGGDSGVDERTVDVNVQRLRKILSGSGFEDYIQTVRCFGYRFGSPGAVRGD
jgi:two-component system phosphate regulon response regulator PhoB